MDSTVIQEIANQLGMAADQAGMFITEQLPNYAALKMMQSLVPLVIIWTLFAIAAIASLIALAVCYKARKKAINGESDNTDWNYFDSFIVFAFIGAIALFIAFIGVCVTGFTVPEIIGWSNYPEAMLIDMALKAVG